MTSKRIPDNIVVCREQSQTTPTPGRIVDTVHDASAHTRASLPWGYKCAPRTAAPHSAISDRWEHTFTQKQQTLSIMVVKLSHAALCADVFPTLQKCGRGRQLDCGEKRQKLAALPALVEDDSEVEAFQPERSYILHTEGLLRRQKSVSPQRREKMRRQLALPSLSEDEEPWASSRRNWEWSFDAVKQLALFSSSARVPMDLAPNHVYRKKVNVRAEQFGSNRLCGGSKWFCAVTTRWKCQNHKLWSETNVVICNNKAFYYRCYVCTCIHVKCKGIMIINVVFCNVHLCIFFSTSPNLISE